MKKILFSSLLVVSLLVAGCTNPSNTQTSNKESIEIDVLNVDGYMERFNELCLNTISITSSMDYPFEHPKEADKYIEKYKDYEGEIKYNLAYIDAYKDFINGMVKFKSDDNKINEFHNKIIKNAILVQSVLEEAQSMYEKYEKCLEYSEKGIEGDCDHKTHNPDEYQDMYQGLKYYAEISMLNGGSPLISDFTEYLKEIGYNFDKSLEK